MFQHVVSQLSSSHADAVPRACAAAPLAGLVSFDTIRARLNEDLPPGPYLSDKAFAKLLGASTKTLCNQRATKPLRYPMPLKIGDCREGKHVRAEILDWLAHEEVEARTRIVHRCR